jgi:hypothetical protein
MYRTKTSSPEVAELQAKMTELEALLRNSLTQNSNNTTHTHTHTDPNDNNNAPNRHSEASSSGQITQQHRGVHHSQHDSQHVHWQSNQHDHAHTSLAAHTNLVASHGASTDQDSSKVKQSAANTVHGHGIGGQNQSSDGRVGGNSGEGAGTLFVKRNIMEPKKAAEISVSWCIYQG